MGNVTNSTEADAVNKGADAGSQDSAQIYEVTKDARVGDVIPIAAKSDTGTENNATQPAGGTEEVTVIEPELNFVVGDTVDVEHDYSAGPVCEMRLNVWKCIPKSSHFSVLAS